MRPVKVENVNNKEKLLVCRLCLATSGNLFSIHENKLEKQFLEVFGIAVSPSDGFPQHICSWCLHLTVSFEKFRTRCRRGQELLQALRKENRITTNAITSIDRASHQLTLHLTAHTNTTLIECEHQEPDPVIVKYEVEIKPNNEVNDEANGEVSEVVVKYEDLDDNIDAEDIEYKEVEIKKLRSSKRKKKDEKEVKRVEKKNLPKVKEKKIKKMFDCEEDFPKFESKYNMEIVVLTMEQQLENMAARKNSSNYTNSPYKCQLCFKGFSSEATFRNHNLKHHDPSVGAQQCELCHSRFRIPAFLRTHMETHRLKFVCKDCRFVASNRYHAITHFREHSGFKYVCKYCGATFKKPSTHGTHVRIQHPTENTSCDVCGETFQGEFGLRMHKTRAHKQNSESESGSLHCSSCGVQFASSYAMARHTFTALDNTCNPSMRACTLCGENLASEELLRAHAQERHRGPETRCDECNKTFLTEASLSVHYERVHLQVKSVRRKAAHHARRQYGGSVMCELCGKRCKNSTILKYHQRTHTGERPHHCPRCPKRFVSPMLLHNTVLQYHQRTHTGERPHHCPRCPKRFVSPMLLHCHLRSHTGERPYKCAQCHKSFTQKSALTVHKTVHTGEKPFACSICGKTFTQAASVHTHVKYVHMKMPAPPRRRNLKRE